MKTKARYSFEEITLKSIKLTGIKLKKVTFNSHIFRNLLKESHIKERTKLEITPQLAHAARATIQGRERTKETKCMTALGKMNEGQTQRQGREKNMRQRTRKTALREEESAENRDGRLPVSERTKRSKE